MSEQFDAVAYTLDYRQKARELCKVLTPDEMKLRRMLRYCWTRRQCSNPFVGYMIHPRNYGWTTLKSKHFTWKVIEEKKLAVGTLKPESQKIVDANIAIEREQEVRIFEQLDKRVEERLSDTNTTDLLEAELHKEYLYAKALMSGITNPFGLPGKTLFAIDIISNVNCKTVDEFKRQFKATLPKEVLDKMAIINDKTEVPDEIYDDFDLYCDFVFSFGVKVNRKEHDKWA